MAAAVTALFVTGTLLVVPLAVVLFTRGHVKLWLPVFGHFPVWALLVVALAALGAWWKGPDRATELLAHWWCTAKPRELGVTLGLWVIVVAIAVATNLVLR